ncbi:CRISPR-associated helicase/endonuclease Cas3 [Listeria monocytogenes]|uniref:CRISPR-associated helicase/endonuclease Cas3 n=1 Tax=Listeria monocytogenes TaxID=1639 RepID=UPI00087463E8|nr:CRISPR-associated helicase/endonuclease Cas3 [Listeria monocytogenes]EFQ8450499.1 CRISPR-associated helicase/endonuclease Cas3 [Listeria monocytogenes]EKZ1103499.1 CRISPR-associated helicase/endonuclease Cas3 [Listeria monocytogenes]EKZ1162745.1 CRISPR-associated helicase/endonuclease Cas3 [Listeria monocytogenes]OFG33335.1 CRISPR-associated helicase/endonuclease Cas3 [Listeria monocytogenes]HAO6527473.1 CRISPR-associated helicase/endonuclease Cas3 [Listeria monocytogenes]
MKKYLAKSDPVETIQEHTDKLLLNYQLIKELYPKIEVDWYLLELVCLLHDLGKMNVLFQRKMIYGGSPPGEIRHGFLSVAFVPVKKLKALGYSKKDIKLVHTAIALHHERKRKTDVEQWKLEIPKLREQWNDFSYEKLQDNAEYKEKISLDYFYPGSRIFEGNSTADAETFKKYVLLKGLLNRIDYAASGGIDVELENDFLMDSMEVQLAHFKAENLEADWNALQKYMMQHQNENIVVIAETGMGKTEAGLLWLGNNKGFFTLPLRTAINAIYERITKNIVTTNQAERVGLLHSETYSQYLLHEGNAEMDIDEYYTRTRQMSLPITICTLDQLFDFVFRYAGFEHKLATLSYSKVIIDEIQMYSPDLLAYLILGLSYIDKFGGKFCIMTATLPGIVTDLLLENGVDFVQPEEKFVSSRIRHSMEMVHTEVESEFIKPFFNNNRILVICNTINKAKKIYLELKEHFQGEEIHLIHSQFIKKDRSAKEDAIFKDGQKDSTKKCIWVATQVVEASLDIDFDLLFTELSDVNGLFQRMGRCYRNRALDVDTNVYVFDGGAKVCSGVGIDNFIDKLIFENSKTILNEHAGVLTEEKKIELVEQVYSTEALSGSKFYNDLIDKLNYVKAFESYLMNKADVRKRFRNINSVSVIPEEVWQENAEEINSYFAILRKTSKEISTKEKMIARTNLAEFMVSVPDYLYKKGESVVREINRYESVIEFKCGYSSDVGVFMR